MTVGTDGNNYSITLYMDKLQDFSTGGVSHIVQLLHKFLSMNNTWVVQRCSRDIHRVAVSIRFSYWNAHTHWYEIIKSNTPFESPFYEQFSAACFVPVAYTARKLGSFAILDIHRSICNSMETFRVRSIYLNLNYLLLYSCTTHAQFLCYALPFKKIDATCTIKCYVTSRIWRHRVGETPESCWQGLTLYFATQME